MEATCRDCGRTWTAEGECHCAGCCEHFGSITAFDRHQNADGCHNPASVTKRDGTPGLVAIERRHGRTWVTKLRELTVP